MCKNTEGVFAKIHKLKYLHQFPEDTKCDSVDERPGIESGP